MLNPADSLIEYPCDFPIKIMGAMQETFAQTIVEVVRSHDPEFHAGNIVPRNKNLSPEPRTENGSCGAKLF